MVEDAVHRVVVRLGPVGFLQNAVHRSVVGFAAEGDGFLVVEGGGWLSTVGTTV